MKNASQGMLTIFDYATQQMRITIDERTVYLNHYPFLTFAHWNPSIYGGNVSYDLFGHVHLRKNDTGFDAQFLKAYKSTQYEVGVDFNNYTPIAWEEVNRRIQYQIENNTNVEHWLNND